MRATQEQNVETSNSWPATVQARREALSWSRYLLAKKAEITADTVAAIEEGKHSRGVHRHIRKAIDAALAAGEHKKEGT